MLCFMTKYSPTTYHTSQYCVLWPDLIPSAAAPLPIPLLGLLLIEQRGAKGRLHPRFLPQHHYHHHRLEADSTVYLHSV